MVTGSDPIINERVEDGISKKVIDRGNEMNGEKFEEINLAAPCGFYCGTCRHYLARAKGLLKEKNLKHGYKGCRIQDKNCAFIKKDCALTRKHEIEFCFECDNFPCENLIKLNQRHYRDDNLRMIDDLRMIKKIGAKQWLKEQEEMWRCTKCG